MRSKIAESLRSFNRYANGVIDSSCFFLEQKDLPELKGDFSVSVTKFHQKPELTLTTRNQEDYLTAHFFISEWLEHIKPVADRNEDRIYVRWDDEELSIQLWYYK